MQKFSTILTKKDIRLLNLFITSRKRIIARTQTNFTIKQQKQIGKAIKRARLFNI